MIRSDRAPLEVSQGQGIGAARENLGVAAAEDEGFAKL